MSRPTQAGVWGVGVYAISGGGALEGFWCRGGALSGVSAQWSEPCTLVGAEAPFAVIVIVGRGRTPQFAVAAAGAGTALVLVAQEGEGEDTGGAFRVPANGGHGCGGRDMGQGAVRRLWPPPENDTMRTSMSHESGVLTPPWAEKKQALYTCLDNPGQ